MLKAQYDIGLPNDHILHIKCLDYVSYLRDQCDNITRLVIFSPLQLLVT